MYRDCSTSAAGILDSRRQPEAQEDSSLQYQEQLGHGELAHIPRWLFSLEGVVKPPAYCSPQGLLSLGMKVCPS